MKIEINKGITKKNFRIICLLGILFSLLPLYSSIEGIFDVNILKTAIKIDGKVIENTYTSESSSNSQSHYSVKFEYKVNEIEYEAYDEPGTKFVYYNIGDRVAIYYTKNNPRRAKIYRIDYPILIFSIVLLSGLSAGLIVNEKRFKKMP